MLVDKFGIKMSILVDLRKGTRRHLNKDQSVMRIFYGKANACETRELARLGCIIAEPSMKHGSDTHHQTLKERYCVLES